MVTRPPPKLKVLTILGVMICWKLIDRFWRRLKMLIASGSARAESGGRAVRAVVGFRENVAAENLGVGRKVMVQPDNVKITVGGVDAVLLPVARAGDRVGGSPVRKRNIVQYFE